MSKKTGLIVALIILVLLVIFGMGGRGDKQQSANQARQGDENTAPAEKLFGDEYTLDVALSTMVWSGSKIGGSHTGDVTFRDGTLSINEEMIVGGEVNIDLDTITNTDIEDLEQNKKLIDHLKSEDFFNVALDPLARFVLERFEEVEGEDGTNAMVYGHLTIKKIKRDISFPATISVVDGVATADASFELDRTNWDIRFGSDRFFDNLGDKVIHDEMQFEISLVANEA